MAGSEAIYPVLADWPCQTWTSPGKLKAASADLIRHFHHQSWRSRESCTGKSGDPSYKCLLFGVRENLSRFVRLRGRSLSSEPVTQGSRRHIVCLRCSLFRWIEPRIIFSDSPLYISFRISHSCASHDCSVVIYRTKYRQSQMASARFSADYEKIHAH